ncbi:MAG: GTPase Era [Treponemataceae bacterium]
MENKNRDISENEKLKSKIACKEDEAECLKSDFMPDEKNICETDHKTKSILDNKTICKSGVVAIAGRASVGKSTFLNVASGEKISIVSTVPQTTRNSVKGIVNTSLGQLVFIDTPGFHNSEKKLNKKLRSVSKEQLESSDAILYLLDASRLPGEEENFTADHIKPYANKTVIGINKIDLPEADSKKLRAFIKEKLPMISPDRIFDLSAKEDNGINSVLKALFEFACESSALYPEEFYTDQEVDFRIAEIIREQAINRLFDEIPHALYVEISDMEMRKNNRELWIRAFIVVERESQKGIVIGKSACMIKTIRIESLKALRKIFDYKIDLDLQVKVNKNWRQKDFILSKLIR